MMLCMTAAVAFLDLGLWHCSEVPLQQPQLVMHCSHNHINVAQDRSWFPLNRAVDVADRASRLCTSLGVCRSSIVHVVHSPLTSQLNIALVP